MPHDCPSQREEKRRLTKKSRVTELNQAREKTRINIGAPVQRWNKVQTMSCQERRRVSCFSAPQVRTPAWYTFILCFNHKATVAAVTHNSHNSAYGLTMLQSSCVACWLVRQLRCLHLSLWPLANLSFWPLANLSFKWPSSYVSLCSVCSEVVEMVQRNNVTRASERQHGVAAANKLVTSSTAIWGTLFVTQDIYSDLHEELVIVN